MIERIVVPPVSLSLSWRNGFLVEAVLAWADQDEKPSPSKRCSEIETTLAGYVAGEPVTWPEIPLSLESLPEFSRRVLIELRDTVGWGETITYGELAVQCGSPKGARAVGMVMNRNPWPLLVPCHRVVGRDGSLTGFGSGLDLKKYLLSLEGSFP
ncbi:MAG: methylated-DNA--[protein]-cysteine S-methyltransferase [Desulfovibrionales bacterium]